jgi:hypothetical protein
MPHLSGRNRALRTLVPTLAAAVYSVLLARTLPLTYDEARNWLVYVRHGAHYVTHNYLTANNHVLFTVLQSLVPASLVHDDPLNLRLINIAVAILLVNLMFRWLVDAGVPWLLSIAGLLLAGPITVLYLGVARGYLLGTLLAFLGIHLLAGRGGRPAAALGAGVLFALAIYTVPTFALGMVGVVALLLWHRRTTDVLVWGSTATLIALLLYLPIIHEVVSAGRGHPAGGGFRHYAGTLTPGAYSVSVLRDSLYLTAFGSDALWLSIAFVLAAGLVFTAVRRPGGLSRLRAMAVAAAGRDTTVFDLVAAYSVGTLVVIELANATRLTAAPFYRNSLFVGYAVVLWLLRELGRGDAERWRRGVFVALVGANLVASTIGVSLLLRGDDYSTSRYGDVLVTTPPPALRNVSHLGATRVVCSKSDMQVCGIYVPYLRRRGVRVVRTPWTTDRHRCVSGHVPPIPRHGVVVWRGAHELGLLCGE